MAKNEKASSSSYQSLGNGMYRVGGAVTRNAVTGRYVTHSSAASRSNGAVTERSSGPSNATIKRG